MERVNKLNLIDSFEEIQPRGSSAFPLSSYESELSEYDLGYLELHWHKDLQFVYLISGSCIFQVNGKEIFLNKGMGIFINSECLHMAKAAENNALCAHIVFDPSIITGNLGSAIDLKYVAPVIKSRYFPYIIFTPAIPWQKKILNHLYIIHDMQTEGNNLFQLDITIHLLNIWKLIYDNIDHGLLADQGIHKDDYARIKIILSYIHANYKNAISLEEIANEIHLSKTECCKYFKKNMNCTIFTYINDYRLKQSANALLNKKNLSISDIAYEYGFGSSSAFIEKFRKKTGLTPLKYRKIYLE